MPLRAPGLNLRPFSQLDPARGLLFASMGAPVCWLPSCGVVQRAGARSASDACCNEVLVAGGDTIHSDRHGKHFVAQSATVPTSGGRMTTVLGGSRGQILLTRVSLRAGPLVFAT